MRLRIVLLMATTSLLLVMAACIERAAEEPEPTPTLEPAAMMELDDETFLGAMIEHHEGAVEMARIALERAEREEIREMAMEIIEAQEAEIGMMESWMNDWFGHGGHGADHGVSHAEMGMDMDMDEFRQADPFDRAFIDAMIVHHEGAIEMARAIRDSTEREELQSLADEIIEAQEAEIEQMRQWRQEWYGD
jgi:uncharacterized protein (DUF305 family)